MRANNLILFDIYRRKQSKLPTSDGYAAITANAINATAHHDAANIPVHAPTLAVLTWRWGNP